MKQWPHAPVHILDEAGTYFVTAATYGKEHRFASSARLDRLQELLLTFAASYGWLLQAWAIFSNHYHFVAMSPDHAESLRGFLRDLHSASGREINRLDGTVGRQVWYQFWDKRLTFQRSYLTRLNYVHQNAVHHRMAAVVGDYRWCSAAWFQATASPAFVKTVASFKTDRLSAAEDLAPIPPED